MITFRPDVIFYPAGEFFPWLGSEMMSEDFRWAMWLSVGPKPLAEDALKFAKQAAEIARGHEKQLPRFPEAVLVQMRAGSSQELDPIPLLLSCNACGDSILGVFSDARPDSTDNT